MELDDQLAALVAGELDDDTARALRARAVADPALARRLARHERLQALLTTWEAAPLSDTATARIDAAIEGALADLDDGPLVERAAPTGPPAAVPVRPTREDPAPTPARAASDDVVDLGAARARRDQRAGVPAWLSGTAVAAALLAVVGVGVVLGNGGFGADDSDIMADSATDESAETDLPESDDTDADAEAFDDEATALAPTTPDDLVIAEGDLLTLVDAAAQRDTPPQEDADSGAAGDVAEDTAGAGPDACVVEALDRDTAGTEGREVVFLAAGSYAGESAQFVVVRSPADGDGDRYDVLAYDPTDCRLLARDDEVR